MTYNIEKVAVIGMGIIGTQIAIQAACYGYQVSGFDEVKGSFERSNDIILSSIKAQKMLPVTGLETWHQGLAKVSLTSELEQVLADADLVIEAVPEQMELKRAIFAKLDRLSPERTILATNSSTIPISKIEDVTKKPSKCLNLHFYFPALGMNLVDVMGGRHTSIKTIETCMKWVRSIGCIPIRLKKETFGFCLNRIQHAARREAMRMWADGNVDFEDMDRAWMTWTGMPFGLFGMMDQIGLDVVYNVELSYFNETKDPKYKPPTALKKMVENCELGYKTGKGFYSYPDPEYKELDFLSTGKSDVSK
ncbi:MAG: 3-hydroxyacyl-CoA dehydrogenase family protein [Proteobacteria bacterium]|nr:3-hydroxyacyl-CoA dehydrogenase family protein [Pseudomonadota bacterium]MBU2466763.1 3-hydroxyacyl-CoA dehydrogenase family protein [Bacteroidota bacterium]MBU2518167.1 3-hydroxyacyl-CoA dehydrogenase family protein [Pseudomonadota bacterium]